MSKITIDIPKDIADKIKAKAKDNCRSMTQEIIYTLRLYANDQLHQFDEGSQISVKQTIQKPKTPEEIEEEQITHFQKLAKQILGHELNISENALDPTNKYYEFAKQEEGKFLRWPYTMSEQKQREYLEEWKQYE